MCLAETKTTREVENMVGNYLQNSLTIYASEDAVTWSRAYLYDWGFTPDKIARRQSLYILHVALPLPAPWTRPSSEISPLRLSTHFSCSSQLLALRKHPRLRLRPLTSSRNLRWSGKSMH